MNPILSLARKLLISLALFCTTACSKPPVASYGTYVMHIGHIDQLHELTVRADLTFEHKVTNRSRTPNPETFHESGTFKLSKSEGGFDQITPDSFSFGYDFMSPRATTRTVPFQKHGGPTLFFDTDPAGKVVLVSESEYGYYYEKK